MSRVRTPGATCTSSTTSTRPLTRRPRRPQRSPPAPCRTPTTQTFLLHSLPGSSRVIYLDFKATSCRYDLGPSWGPAFVAVPGLMPSARALRRSRCRAGGGAGRLAAGERGLRPVRRRRDDGRPGLAALRAAPRATGSTAFGRYHAGARRQLIALWRRVYRYRLHRDVQQPDARRRTTTSSRHGSLPPDRPGRESSRGHRLPRRWDTTLASSMTGSGEGTLTTAEQMGGSTHGLPVRPAHHAVEQG